MFEKSKIKSLKADIQELLDEKTSLLESIAVLEDKNKLLKEQNAELENNITSVKLKDEYGIPYYHNNLSELGLKRSRKEKELDEILKKGLWKIERAYSLNGSSANGRTTQEAFGDGMIYALNAYICNKEKSITVANCNKTYDLINAKFKQLNHKAEKMGIKLNDNYVICRIELIKINLMIKIKEKEERDKIKEEKRRLREQEKLLEEIAVEEKRIEKERIAMDVAFDKALTDEERENIKSQMSALDKRLNDLHYRRNHSKAGWLYVITNPSFPSLVKVGTTRRINPTLRVKELSSSSTPYTFTTHGFVFSDDCFDLEAKVHKYFDDQRINPDREFFEITPKQVIDTLRDVFHCEVHFINEGDDEDGSTEEDC